MTETRTYHPLTPDTFDTVLAVDSRIETWDGVWGTVTKIEDVDTHGHVFERLVTFHAQHTTTYDRHGWPVDGGPMDITRTVRRYSSDLRLVSTADNPQRHAMARRGFLARAVGEETALADSGPWA